MAGALPWYGTEVVGGWWNRRFDPELDLIGADRAPIARQLSFAGSVKWLRTPFDEHDLAALQRGAARVPGFRMETSGLLAVSLSGATPDVRAVDDVLVGPEDVVRAWRPEN